ncbi:hypothetical protein PMAYCL1PPCAC_19280 [Pristionchus mayeri]|uniref:Dehydrogenase n=1 Tax=Pristionchus mayeri TaxID=1317129 RepID=A0AAN5CR81_9BILA|nr:hypothetical protein PMAYCL1PPCAC_19280 [Pristionchus mayeri]
MKNRVVRIRTGTETALVTGADGTIGSQIVFLLIKLGFNVCALSGSAAKMRTVIADWSPEEKARVKVFQINFAEPLRMRTYLEQLRERFEQFDVVVLAAGTMLAPDGPVHGYEHHAWVNVIAQAAVLRAVEEKMADDARIVCLSSVCAHLALSSDLADPELLHSQRHGVYEAYARSKLHLAVYCEQLAKEWGSGGGSSSTRASSTSSSPMLAATPPSTARRIVSVHPGVVAGGLYRHTNVLTRWLSDRAANFLRSPVMAATFVIHTALRDDAVSGGYYEDRERVRLQPEFRQPRRALVFKQIEKAVDDLFAPAQPSS